MTSGVLVIYTGGTIGMVNAVAGNTASPLVPVQNERDLTASVPQLADLSRVVPFQVVPLRDHEGNQIEAVDSSDITVRHWVAIAEQIAEHYTEFDGFVILHGTDTMAYTASALSFMLNNLAKPVVLSGSQIPISRYDSDAVWNFARAVQIAGYAHSDLPLVPEVCIGFDERLFRGNRVRKMSTSAAQAFDSPNYPPLGFLGTQVRIQRAMVADPPDNAASPFFVQTSLDPRVLDFALFPGLNPDALGRILEMVDVQGIVLRTFGAGNAPNDARLLAVLAEGIADDKVIVNVTPCPEGGVEAGLYAASTSLLEIGVLSGFDLTPEAALTKLMWSLGTQPDRAGVRSQMQVNQRGEQTQGAVKAR